MAALLEEHPAAVRVGRGAEGVRTGRGLEKAIVCSAHLRVCSKQTTFENKSLSVDDGERQGHQTRKVENLRRSGRQVDHAPTGHGRVVGLSR
jgi:hypothetical protein